VDTTVNTNYTNKHLLRYHLPTSFHTRKHAKYSRDAESVWYDGRSNHRRRSTNEALQQPAGSWHLLFVSRRLRHHVVIFVRPTAPRTSSKSSLNHRYKTPAMANNEDDRGFGGASLPAVMKPDADEPIPSRAPPLP